MDLDVAGSIPVTRPNFQSDSRTGDRPRRLPRRSLGQRRTHPFQALQRAEDLWLIVGEMANDYVSVAKFPDGMELLRHLAIDPAISASAGMPR